MSQPTQSPLPKNVRGTTPGDQLAGVIHGTSEFAEPTELSI